MRILCNYIIASCLLILISIGIVDAQQNLAQEAYAIMEQSCLICHGESGSYTEALIIEHTALIDDGKVIPGDPEGSIFYQRLIETDDVKRMPLGQPPLDVTAIETIRQWIAAGAPDWDAVPRPNISFITTEAMLETIENHVNSLSPSDKSFARYFTLTHLYNAGETTKALQTYRRALSKLINSLSWGREAIKPQSIDAEETVFYIDLRDYEWDVRNNAWTQIEQAYPYKITYDAPTQTHLREKLTTLQQEMNCEVPFVHVDWFIANASLPPLYHDILQLPLTDRELEEKLGISVKENIQNAPRKRVWRAGFSDSGVSNHNRVVERHIFQHGAYWKSYDFAGSAESQNIFTHPLNFTHDGGEIIFNLPNGLQAYLLVDSNGNRLDVAPTDIVSNPAASDPAVRNGLSCIGCHTEGMKTFEDEVRAVVEQADNPPFNKARALELYVEQDVMDELVEEDTLRYREALEAAGGIFGGIEPVQRFHEVFQGTLDAAHAAAAVGLETDTFLERISKSPTLQNLLGALVLENGVIKRDAWTSAFHDVISALNSPDIVLPPIEQQPERIPGASVNIPDLNLRAVIEEALGKAAGDVITVEEMATLTSLIASNRDIQDLTGLESAINMEELWIGKNPISDLSPLAGLVNLIGLGAWETPISDLSSLAGLKKLRWLDFGHSPTDVNKDLIGNLDLTPLAGITSLRKLTFYACGIKDISPLAGLTGLIHLAVGGNRTITDASSVAGLINLEHLDFHHDSISDISPLVGLTKLKYLNLYDNRLISDVSPLEGLTKLEVLHLHRNKISDVSSLAALTNLKELILRDNLISDISPLQGLSVFSDINWADNPGSAIGSPKIEGPWTWMMVTAEEHLDTDWLAIASDGKVTEQNVATYGARLGSAVGNNMWVTSKIKPNSININNLAESIGEQKTIRSYALYGSIILESPREQNTVMLQGSNSLIKIWLNGDMVHKDKSTKGWAYDYEKFFPVTLKQGANVLLVNILFTLHSERSRVTGYFGFEEGTNYKVLKTSDIDITDPNLRSVIAEALAKKDVADPITFHEMTTLTTLNASNRDIKDLTGLEYAVNLENLNAHDNQITDLSPVSKLFNLRVLNIYNNPVENISAIAGLSNLEVLTLIGDGGISDISPITGFVKLRYFLTWGNPISDLSPLAGLTQLETLDICGSEASDISPLAKLTGLKELYLVQNRISDLSALSGLTNLIRLNLRENNISDVSPLAALTQLKWLGLHHNSISDFSPLVELSETTISRAFNPGVPTGGPKIEGPWLWVTVPGERLDNTTDLLAEASGGSVTDQHIAAHGAKEGKLVGNNLWTQAKIAPSGDLNIINLLNQIGSQTNSDNNNHIIYGSIVLNSLHEQDTNMFFGCGGKVKIWLNGTLIYQNFVWRRGGDYQDFFPATLKKGVNVLLVAVENGPEFGWSGHFGFEEGTEYTVVPPGIGFTFSTTATDLLSGDTFTLNLNAENITDLAGWQTDITFDPNVLEAVEVTEGDFLKSEGGDTFFQGGTIDNATGNISTIFSTRISENGSSGTGALLSVIFKAKAAGETQVKLENFEFVSITDDIIPTVHPNITITVGEYPAWDVNQDGRVSILDLILVARDFGSGATANLRTDVNRDGVINIQDLIIVAQHMGETTDSAAPNVYVMDSKELTPAIVQEWIQLAQIEDDGSLAFQQGIENLQRLLASLIPEKTALLANYPNPFNPETWIPYQLAKPAEVTLTIYTINGSVIRILALGHQGAGIYQSRSRAAYWDGRNDVGEFAASGIYFYTLTAGDFIATRRMLILK